MSDKPNKHRPSSEADRTFQEVIAELERRLEGARRGEAVSGADLGEKLLCLYAPLMSGKVPPQFPQYAARVRELISELTLVLSEQKAHAARELDHVRRGKKAGRAYRKSD